MERSWRPTPTGIITALLDEINEELSWSGLRMETNEEYVPEHLAEMLAAYAKFYQLDEADFVHGRGRRKTIRQRRCERLQAHMRISWRNTARS